MSDSDETPTLPEVIRTQIGRVMNGMHTCMPGRVVSYSAAKQQAVVQPLLKMTRRGPDGTTIVDTLPVVDGVPVVFPGAGAYSITFPVSAGDTVLLVFAEASLDKWLIQDGIVDPADPRRFTLTDAIAIPGLRTFRNPISPAPASDKIKIGTHSAADPVARMSDLAAVVSALNGHTHFVTVAGTATTQEGTTATPLPQATTPGCCPTVVVD